MTKRTKSDLLLLLTAFIWGSAFVAQKVGSDIGAFTFNGLRNLIGGMFLFVVICIFSKFKKVDSKQEERNACKKSTLVGGICCGVALFAASSLQQLGIGYTTAGKAGFITSLYAVIVPILSVFLEKKVRPVIWLCAVLGAAGLYFLSIKPGELTLEKGDLIILGCAVVFAVHILIIDYFSPKADPVKMSCIQFLTAGLLGLLGMFVFEDPNPGVILQYSIPVLYAGILSSGVAYTLQIAAQANADPSEASLILCLESVFSILTSTLVLHESMSVRGYTGCVLIFGAVVISQLPSRKKCVE